MSTTRRNAVGNVMVWVCDMLEINGIAHRPEGYAVEAFRFDGWDMRIQITARRSAADDHDEGDDDSTGGNDGEWIHA